MRPLALDLHAAPEELRAGLAELSAERPARFKSGKNSVPVRFEKIEAAGGRCAATGDGQAVAVRYARRTDAFRALGRLLGMDDPAAAAFDETARFDLLGAMVDVSRNGVARPETVRLLLRRFALMGLDTLMLYSEDTYEVPGEPFFGYLRGRYTQEELRALDAYAADLGIEMFPCIQTLGHLEQILQWPAYMHLKDAGGVLIAEEPATYALLEKMIRAASAPFRSKRIHIGMDEAHWIGTGAYRQKFGEKDPFAILNGHLNRVREICHGLGLRPMIWSDMYFRLGSKIHDYYDKEWEISPETVANIPKDVQLVYWDYYHLEQPFYEEWIERHRRLGSEPVMAGGVWTWNRLWAALPFSFATTEACLRACKAKGLREAFATMWGDDGMECDLLSALPGVQYFAEHGYADAVDPALLRANFRGSCGGDFDAWVRASDLDSVAGIAHPERNSNNLSKLLLWEDPFYSPLDPHTRALPLNEHYAKLAEDLARAAKARDGGPFAARLHYPAQAAQVLALKAGLRERMHAAVAGQDRALAGALAKEAAALRREVEKLWKIHRAMWLATYKPFGWEVIEARYGGLRARLETLAERLKDFAAGKLPTIEELAEPLLPVFPFPDPAQIPNINHDRLKTPSWIK
ncbi:MAG: beta-N-acetylhexosaminidase [Planctomycetota bacterium]|nr:beta-N-acetylhexosaminidase [Planctomycetota bacterium]